MRRVRFAIPDRATRWNETWALAVVFGAASVPWTYAFVAGSVPLWPSFVASATYYAAGGSLDGLRRGAASNLVGVAYAAATIGLVDGLFGGGIVALSAVVGAFMLLASLHEFLPLLSFTPGGFLGYATLFSVHAADAAAFGVPDLAGQTLAAASAMAAGACIGYGTDVASDALA